MESTQFGNFFLFFILRVFLVRFQFNYASEPMAKCADFSHVWMYWPTNFWNCLIFIQSNNIDCSFLRLKFNENVLQELRVYSFIYCTPSLPLKIKFCWRYLHLSLTELFTDVHRLLNNLLFNSADQGNNSRSMLNNLERRPEVNL